MSLIMSFMSFKKEQPLRVKNNFQQLNIDKWTELTLQLCVWLKKVMTEGDRDMYNLVNVNFCPKFL